MSCRDAGGQFHVAGLANEKHRSGVHRSSAESLWRFIASAAYRAESGKRSNVSDDDCSQHTAHNYSSTHTGYTQNIHKSLIQRRISFSRTGVSRCFSFLNPFLSSIISQHITGQNLGVSGSLDTKGFTPLRSLLDCYINPYRFFVLLKIPLKNRSDLIRWMMCLAYIR